MRWLEVWFVTNTTLLEWDRIINSKSNDPYTISDLRRLHGKSISVIVNLKSECLNWPDWNSSGTKLQNR
jgi:hypothetical protein